MNGFDKKVLGIETSEELMSLRDAIIKLLAKEELRETQEAELEKLRAVIRARDEAWRNNVDAVLLEVHKTVQENRIIANERAGVLANELKQSLADLWRELSTSEAKGAGIWASNKFFVAIVTSMLGAILGLVSYLLIMHLR